jgi:hypothetical protein
MKIELSKKILHLFLGFIFLGCSAKSNISNLKNSNQNKKYDYVIQVTINASKERVWEIITDFKNYPKWNSVLTMQNNDNFEIGKEFDVTIFNKDGSIADNFKAIAEQKNQFQLFWASSTMMHKKFFKAIHYFIVEEISKTKVKFIQKWKLEGIISYLLEGMIFEQLDLFKLMNTQLKKQAESNNYR